MPVKQQQQQQKRKTTVNSNSNIQRLSNSAGGKAVPAQRNTSQPTTATATPRRAKQHELQQKLKLPQLTKVKAALPTIQPQHTTPRQRRKSVVVESASTSASSSDDDDDNNVKHNYHTISDSEDLQDGIQLPDIDDDVNVDSASSSSSSSSNHSDDDLVDDFEQFGNNDNIAAQSTTSDDDDDNEDDEEAEALLTSIRNRTHPSLSAAPASRQQPVAYSESTPRKQYYSDDETYGPDAVVDARVADRDKANLADLSDSDAEAHETGRELRYANRTGNVPLTWYDDESHIGYSAEGQRVARKNGGGMDSIDHFLANIGGDNPNYSRTIYDPLTDNYIVLSDSELATLQSWRKGRFTDGSFNEHADMVEFYTSKLRVEAVGDGMEPKRRFVPSVHEAKALRRMVNSLRNGWMKSVEEREAEKQQKRIERESEFEIWDDTDAVIDPSDRSRRMADTRLAAAPKLPPPTHYESYNPPPEYVPSEAERVQTELLDDKDKPYVNYLPKIHTSMRSLGRYAASVKERFERCLDLYLAPRVRRVKLNIDPTSLIPKLPKPSQLKPYPTTLTLTYQGHHGRVRALSISPDGQWMATGGEDGVVLLWELNTCRVYKRWQFVNDDDDSGDAIIESVQFNPQLSIPLLLVAVSAYAFVLCTHTASDAQNMSAMKLLFDIPQQELTGALDDNEVSARQRNHLKTVDWRVSREQRSGVIHVASVPTKKKHEVATQDDDAVGGGKDDKPETVVESQPADDEQLETNTAALAGDVTAAELPNLTGIERTILLRVNTGRRVKHVAWHHRGDYFSTVQLVDNSTSSILIHRLSTHVSQSPFKRSFGYVTSTMFHTSKPYFFVATKTSIRVYNLQSQAIVRQLVGPSRWLSSVALHPSGDHVLTGGYDRRVAWFDLDAGEKPYKSLKYHSKAVRAVAFHSSYPLYATASDDGSIHIFHATVYDDMLTLPLIVPVKVLQAHAPTDATGKLGVLNIQWHPTQPWLLSSGADHLVKLWTST